MTTATLTLEERAVIALARLDESRWPAWEDAPTHRERQERIAERRGRDAIRQEIHFARQVLAPAAVAFGRLESAERTAHHALDHFTDEAERPNARGDAIDAYRLGVAWVREGKGGGSTRPGAVIAYEATHKVQLRPLPLLARELEQARTQHDAAQRRLDAALAAAEAELTTE